jgi:hypothetical protein
MKDNELILQRLEEIEKATGLRKDKEAKEEQKALEEAEKFAIDKSYEGVQAQLAKMQEMIEKTVSTTTSSTFAERQHLDKQILDVTDRDTPMLDAVEVVKANGKTHEWDMVVELGSSDTAVAECGTPPVNEVEIKRFSAQIKTFASRVEVCDLAQWSASDYFDLTNTHVEGGIRKIVQDVNKKAYYGNATSRPAEFDGIYQYVSTHSAGNLVNGNAGTITTTLLDNAIQKVIEAGGKTTHIFLGAKSLRDLAALWASSVTYNDPETGKRTFGYEIGAYHSPFGVHQIVFDEMINATNSPNTHSDVFLLNLKSIKMAQSEPMYRLPVYRALTLAETHAVVWNCVLEVKIPMHQAIIYNVQ